MSENQTWREIARAIRFKSKQDYQDRIKPKVIEGKDRLGALIEALGRKIQSDRK